MRQSERVRLAGSQILNGIRSEPEWRRLDAASDHDEAALVEQSEYFERRLAESLGGIADDDFREAVGIYIGTRLAAAAGII